MLDLLLTNNLLKAVQPGTRVLFVGDVDQLPSVGPGMVLRSIIDSGVIPVVRLTEVFRQAASKDLNAFYQTVKRATLRSSASLRKEIDQKISRAIMTAAQ